MSSDLPSLKEDVAELLADLHQGVQCASKGVRALCLKVVLLERGLFPGSAAPGLESQIVASLFDCESVLRVQELDRKVRFQLGDRRRELGSLFDGVVERLPARGHNTVSQGTRMLVKVSVRTSSRRACASAVRRGAFRPDGSRCSGSRASPSGSHPRRCRPVLMIFRQHSVDET